MWRQILVLDAHRGQGEGDGLHRIHLARNDVVAVGGALQMGFAEVTIVLPSNPTHPPLPRPDDLQELYQALMTDVRLLMDDQGPIPSPLLPHADLLGRLGDHLVTQPLRIIGVIPLLGLLDADLFPSECGHGHPPLSWSLDHCRAR